MAQATAAAEAAVNLAAVMATDCIPNPRRPRLSCHSPGSLADTERTMRSLGSMSRRRYSSSSSTVIRRTSPNEECIRKAAVSALTTIVAGLPPAALAAPPNKEGEESGSAGWLTNDLVWKQASTGKGPHQAQASRPPAGNSCRFTQELKRACRTLHLFAVITRHTCGGRSRVTCDDERGEACSF